MDWLSRDSRRHTRYRSGVGTTVVVMAEGEGAPLIAQLIDLDRVGGMGLFLPFESGLAQLPFATFFKPWIVHRTARGRVLQMTVSFRHAVPLTRNGAFGVRISAMAGGDAEARTGEKAIRRRQSERVTSPTAAAVLVSRQGNRIPVKLKDISTRDGAGLVGERSAVAKLTWRQLLGRGWALKIGGRQVAGYITRISQVGEQWLVGFIGGGLFKAATERGGEPLADDDVDDRELIALLGTYLRKK